MKGSRAFTGLLATAILCGCVSEKTKRAEFFAPTMTSADLAKQKKRSLKPPFSRAQAEDEICEAIVRRFARDASSRLRTSSGLVFLGLTEGRMDPDASFLGRFADNRLDVFPISAAAYSPENWIIDSETKKRGAALVIERVDWIDFYHADVPCLWAAEKSKELLFSYKLAWKNGKWSVQ